MSWGGLNEVGAPANGIVFASGETPGRPGMTDLTPVLGPEITPHDARQCITPPAVGRGGRTSLGASCPVISLVPGGRGDTPGGTAPVTPFGRLLSSPPPAPAAFSLGRPIMSKQKSGPKARPGRPAAEPGLSIANPHAA